MNLLDQCITYACDSDQFDFAISLCKAGNRPAGDVHLKLAMALEDDGKFEQAEAEFILAEKPKEAIMMWAYKNHYI